MEHEAELTDVLDGTLEPATVEELEGVVRRAGQRRRARLAAGAAALLAFGAAGGAVARGSGQGAPLGFAGAKEEPRPTPTTAVGDIASAASGDLTGPRPSLKPLFRREANGVAIRAYVVSWDSGDTDPPGKAPCAPPTMVNGELSNGAAVTVAMAPLLPAGTAPNGDAHVTLLTSGAFGQEEGEEATWMIVQADSVAQVRVTSGATTDAMEPKEGLAILIVHGTGSPTVEGLDVNGKVITAATAAKPPEPTPNPACMPQVCVSGGGPGPVPAGGVDQMTPEQKAAVEAKAAAMGEDRVVVDQGPMCHSILSEPPTDVPTAPAGPPVTSLPAPATTLSPAPAPPPGAATTTALPSTSLTAASPAP